MDHYHQNGGGSNTFPEYDLFGHHTSVTVQPRYPEAPGFKVGGTSAEAALKIAPLAGRLIKPILQEFTAAAPIGLTADQCAARVGVSILSMRPRISELKRLGFLAVTGERAENESGMTASVLKAASKASEVLS